MINGALPAIDTAALLRDLPAGLAEHEPDIVTVMIGINDQLAGFVALRDDEAGPFWRRLKIYRLIRLWPERSARLHAQQAEQERQDALEARYLAQLQQNGDPDTVLLLADHLKRQGRFDEARLWLEEALFQRPSAQALVGLASVTDPRPQKRALFEQALQEWPQEHVTYKYVSRFYGHLGAREQVRAILRKQLIRLPDALSSIELAKHLINEQDYTAAEEALRAAIAIDPSYYAHYQLGVLQARQGRLEEAQAALRRSLQLRPCLEAQVQLARVLVRSDQTQQAIQAYEEAMAMADSSVDHSAHTWDHHVMEPNQAHVELARLHQEQGRPAQAQAALDRMSGNRATFHELQALAEQVLDEVGRLVVLQYPMRSVEPLRAMLPARRGLVFVDNERSFQQAVEERGYDALFSDHAGADFGHATPAGHALIAENAAEVILEAFYSSGE